MVSPSSSTSCGRSRPRLLRAVEMGYSAVHRDDLALCMDVDRFDFALTAVDEDGQLTLRKG